MKREQALAAIRAEVGIEGSVTSHALALYCENRVSYAAFQKAAREGMAYFNRSRGSGSPIAQPKERTCDGNINSSRADCDGATASSTAEEGEAGTETSPGRPPRHPAR